MTSKTRQYLWSFVLLSLLILPAFVMVFRALGHPRTADRARDWASALTVSERDRALGKIATFPSAYRLALYATSSPIQRAEVWRRHVRTYIQNRRDVTAEQVRLLDDILSALSSEHVFGPSNRISPADVDRLNRLGEDARRLFGDRDATYLLTSLGPSDTDENVREPLVNRISGWIARALVLEARTEPCECSTQSDWCGIGRECEAGAEGCYAYGGPNPPPWTPGCGTFLLYQCNGMCTTNEGDRPSGS